MSLRDAEVWIDLHDSNSGGYGALLGHTSTELFKVADHGVNVRMSLSPTGLLDTDAGYSVAGTTAIDSSRNATFASVDVTGSFTDSAANRGIKFDSTSMKPSNGSGGDADNHVDLGTSSARFKNLHLSGSIASGDISSTGLTVDYTGNRTGDAGILVTNDASDWGIKVDKDGTDTYGLLVQADGTHAIMVRNSSGAQQALISGTGNADFSGALSISGTTVISSTRRLTPTGIQTSPDTGLYATDATLSYYSSSNAVYLNGAGANGWLRLNASGNANDRTAINLFGQNAGDNITFKTASTLRMQLTSGGVMTIGTTSTTPAFSTGNGHAFHTGDASHISRSGGVALVVNRGASNGEAVQVRRDGTHVGGLGIAGGSNLTVNSAGSGGYGRLQDNGSDVAIWWTNGFYPATDNAKDLGVSANSGRWRRLYMADAIWMSGSKIVDATSNQHCRFVRQRRDG